MLKYSRRWHEMHERCRMKKDELKMAHWARVELRRKVWAERRTRFFSNVRGTFVVLMLMAFSVFISNRQVEAQIVAFERIHHPMNAIPPCSTSNRLRQNALDYEKQVDDISK
jgi:hypothetical protein